MKRIIYVSIFILLVIGLSGCISIPIGEGVLEISTKGIEFVDKDEGVEEETTATGGGGESSETETDGKESLVEEEENTEGEASQEAGATNQADCEKQDHSSVTDHLIQGFYIPECAVLTGVSKNANSLDAYFTVEEDWKKVFEDYKDYFGEHLNSESQKPESGGAEIRAHFYESDSAYTHIAIQQYSENVELRLLQYFPEE